MDILDILLDILLKPPQPFIGLFLMVELLFISRLSSKTQIFIILSKLAQFIISNHRKTGVNGV